MKDIKELQGMTAEEFLDYITEHYESLYDGSADIPVEYDGTIEIPELLEDLKLLKSKLEEANNE